MTSVKSYLEEFQSFNDLGEVKKALKQCGVPRDDIESHDFGKIPELIDRRHRIVHKSDRNDVIGGQGNHKTKSLRKQTVEIYVDDIKKLQNFVTSNFI